MLRSVSLEGSPAGLDADAPTWTGHARVTGPPSRSRASAAASARSQPAARTAVSGARGRLARGLVSYAAGMRAAQRVLWCYLIWYLAVLVRYFDASPTLWASSLGISAIIGTALFLSTTRAGRIPVTLERWQIARLYAMPFCVSSFAALIKGHGFVLVFHPHARDNLIAAAACAAFVTVTALVRRLA